VLTGGAYLHISKNASPSYAEHAREMLSVFASTSPSYLILQSLDLCNAYLSDGYAEKLATCVQKTQAAKQALAKMGYATEVSEPLKIVLRTSPFGYTGEALAAYLRTELIEAEFADDSVLVLMVTPNTRDVDFERLLKAFQSLPKRTPLCQSNTSLPCRVHEQKCSIRKAILSPCERVPVEQAVGRICATPTVSCPPAIPIVISGEVITKEDVPCFLACGIDHISVIQ
jgi:arginine/lysine/ornithine decarboxylase